MKKVFYLISSFFILTYLIFSLQIINADPTSSRCGSSVKCDLNNCESSKNVCSSKTFFRTRSVIEDVSLYFGLNNYYYHRRYFEPYETKWTEEEQRNHLARGIFYEKSTENNKDRNIAKYFLPNNKSEVSVREDGSGDLGSLWFRVISPTGTAYSSEIRLCPERDILGSYFEYRQDFECLNGLWLDVKFAVYRARHRLHAKETLTNPDVEGTLTGGRTVLQDLAGSAGSDLKFGKIVKCAEQIGFDDIQVKLGYDFYHKPECGGYLGLYASALIPIAPRPTGEFLFEPLVGRGHWGVGFGADAGYLIWEKEYKSLALMADFSYEYLIKGTEIRSFDLKSNGQWSRYLRVAKQNQPAVSYPAINFTTFPVKVEPRSFVNFWTGLHYQHCDWHFEVGYNLWWKQSEKICLDKKCEVQKFDNLNIGIFGMGNVCNPTSASTANISQGKTLSGTGNVVQNDPTFVKLTSQDLDVASASHPKTFTNKVYAAIAYDWCLFCRPISLGVGASYEFAHNIAAIQQWGVWGNFETSF